MAPLSGLRVVEVTNLAPVPFGCMILAEQPSPAPRFDRTPLPTPQPPVADVHAVEELLTSWDVPKKRSGN